ncbi:MAG: transketolase [Alphaproteobacteria bacterium]|nr:transketolase [Alphaproteobacteria bacterium]
MPFVFCQWMADVATVLFSEFIKINPADPSWPDRDRFVLSAGHGSMLHYAVNHLMGYADMTMDQIRNFRQLGAITAGHPEYGMASGIETTTGPLGQGLATSVGMALAERIMAARFGEKLVDHRTWVIAGDGCLQEGISHEAIDLAGHLKLGRLTVFWDDNSISIDGGTELSTSTNQIARFRAAGWHVQAVDGHDHDAIRDAVNAAMSNRKPSLIACKTTIGFGAPTLAGTAKTHGAPLGDEEIAATRKALGWSSQPFEIPADVTAAWSQASTRSVKEYDNWKERLESSPKRKRFDAAISGEMSTKFTRMMKAWRKQLKDEAPKLATRQSSQKTLEVVNAATDMTIGGSADLTGSNLTKTADTAPILPGKFKGRYVYYGIREHGMAAAMNGIALHGGLVPYGGTFLVFSDYARGAMRLSALMKQRVVYVMTHDSIGLGEDGPTHQPIEHLAMLRATPNLHVFRPGDAVEVAEAWEAALNLADAPSVLALSRQGTPTLRQEKSSNNMVMRGGYVLAEADGGRDVTLVATGTELALAMEARDLLKQHHNINAAVVSLPCWELFDKEDAGYRKAVLGTGPRVAVEAASGFGWEKYIGMDGGFVGMNSFGESAPGPELYDHFNITAAAVAEKAVAIIKS